MNESRTLVILLFDDVEVLDFCGPFEVFSVANRSTGLPAFIVLTVAEKSGPLLTRGGLSVGPHHQLTPTSASWTMGGSSARRGSQRAST
jgi:transcriptional regulator GlxA family with amidase domain